MTSNSLSPLFVIVLNWNLPKETILCIESVLAGASPDVQIVLVDNHSSDLSVALFRERFGNTVTLIENSNNLGFAAGVNAGIRHALDQGAQSVLLLNNDTIVDTVMIDHLISTANQHRQAGLVGPVIFYADFPERIWRVGDQHTRWLPIPRRLPDRYLSKTNNTPFRLDYITACGMLIRREVLETVGLLNERYFMYYEDADFCQRVRQASYEIWCAPQAKMWHKVSLSAQKQKPATCYMQSWGRVEFYHSYTQGVSWGILVVYLLLRATVVTGHDILTGNWELIQPLWTGVLDGLARRPARLARFIRT